MANIQSVENKIPITLLKIKQISLLSIPTKSQLICQNKLKKLKVKSKYLAFFSLIDLHYKKLK